MGAFPSRVMKSRGAAGLWPSQSWNSIVPSSDSSCKRQRNDRLLAIILLLVAVAIQANGSLSGSKTGDVTAYGLVPVHSSWLPFVYVDSFHAVVNSLVSATQR